jgi:hypothetical protein
MRKLAILALSASALGFTACQHDSPPPTRYTCDASTTTLAACTEFGPLDDYGTSYNEWLCGNQGGTWGTAQCPETNRLASCAWPASRGGSVQYWYATYAGSLTDVESQCTMYGGTWTTYLH